MAGQPVDGEGRSTARAVPSSAARLGEQYELGDYEWAQEDRPRPGMIRFELGMMLISSGVFLPVPATLAGSSDATVALIGTTMLPFFPAVVLGGWILAASDWGQDDHETFCDSGGLAQLTCGEPAACVVRWDDVVSLSVVMEPVEGARWVIARGAVCDEVGTCVTVDHRIRITAHCDDARHVIDLGEMPNAFFAHYVVEHAAAIAGVPLRYGEEAGLPPRLPTPRR